MLKTNLKKLKIKNIGIKGSQRVFTAKKINVYKVQFEKINPWQKN